MAQSDLQNKSMEELQKMAKDMKMKTTGMQRDELIQMLEQHRSEGSQGRQASAGQDQM